MKLSDDLEVEIMALLESFANFCDAHGDATTKGRARRAAREIRDDRALRGLFYDKPLPQTNAAFGSERYQPVVPAPAPKPDPSPAERTKTKDGSTVFHVPPGIGDTAWLWMKIAGLAERWSKRVILKPAEDHPRRTEEFIRMLPGVEFGGYSHLTGQEILSYSHKHRPANADELRGYEQPFPCNQHIELGGRIEDFLPELDTHYHLDLRTTKQHNQRANEIVRPSRPTRIPTIGIYPADDGPVNNYHFWNETGWLTIVDGIREALDGVCEFVTIGAKFDENLQGRLAAEFKRANVPLRTCLGEHFGVAAQVLKGVDLLLAFPSGVPIVHTLQGGSCIWWLPREIPNVPGGGNVRNCTGWIPPEALSSGRIETRIVEPPERALAGILRSRAFRRLVDSAKKSRK